MNRSISMSSNQGYLNLHKMCTYFRFIPLSFKKIFQLLLISIHIKIFKPHYITIPRQFLKGQLITVKGQGCKPKF